MITELSHSLQGCATYTFRLLFLDSLKKSLCRNHLNNVQELQTTNRNAAEEITPETSNRL